MVPKKVSIPKAPGIGLILRKLNFHGYNKKVQQSLQRQQKRKKGDGKGDEDQSTAGDLIDCERFEPLFERFKMETLASKIFSNQSYIPPDEQESQNSKPSPTIPTNHETEHPVGLDTKDESATPLPCTKPLKPTRVKKNKDDKDDDEDSDVEEDEDDVVPAEKLEGEDPFGGWMNYLDMYTGPDLDFLNPEGVLPDKK